MKLSFSAEVAKAMADAAPIVALESSVIAQGLPYPHNVDSSEACEAAIRAAGAVPATTALIGGRLCVGITATERELLARGAKDLLKVGERDFAIAVAKKKSGGTTVSGTLAIAQAAGISVFATGGLGGVHRGAEEHFDISQDLGALARHPVAVVCAGAKTVLDLPKTLELLETLAVPVIGVGTDDLPGFYTRETGLLLEHRIDSADEGAAIMRARFIELEQGGIVFAQPPPKPLTRSAVEKHLKAALGLAKTKKVKGKAVTPFLLGEMSKRTKGASLESNLALLENNARFAAELAVAYAKVRR